MLRGGRGLQAMIPFDDEELAYIARLDADADAAHLRAELPGIREASLRTLAVATALLQAGAAGGLSLAEIAAATTRPLVGLEEEPSELERACAAARAEVDALSGDDDACGGLERALSLTLEEGAEEDGDGGGSAGSSAGTHDSSWLAGLGVALRSGSGSAPGSGPGTDAGSPMEVSSGSARSFSGGGGADAPMAADAAAGAHSPLLRSGDELLFDLDDEAGARGGRMASLAASAKPLSPPPLSPLVGPLGKLGFAQGAGLGAHGSLESTDTGFAAPPAPLARSVAAAPPAPWQRAAARRARLRRRAQGLQPAATARGAAGALPAPSAPRGAAYPPPVAGGAPGAVSGVFAGLDGEAWGVFMEVLGEILAAAAGSGRWKQAPVPGRGRGVTAQSCPRF